MKKIWKAAVLPVLIALAAICLTVSCLAFSESEAGAFDFLELDGFRSVLTDTEGESVTMAGVLDLNTLAAHRACERLARYELYYGGEKLLSVELGGVTYAPGGEGKGSGRVQALNGWYAVEFKLDDTRTCYLTGLTGKNLLQVEEELVAAKLQDRYFSMTNVDFIDVEKNSAGDSQLCWAASVSDMLEYTGWARAAGFQDADDTFETFVAAFDDEAGNPRYGLEWFFNGLNRPQEKEWDGWAYALRYDGSFTGYLPDYEATTVIDYITVMNRPLSRMDDALQHLREGWGVSLLIGWYYDSAYRNGGHLITLWGYVEDTAARGRERYPALIVSDSDSDIVTGADRRDAPNRYRILMSDPYDDFGLETWRLDYAETYDALLEDFCCLRPRSPEIGTEQSGTKNKFTTADLLFDGADLTSLDGTNPDVFTAGLPITVAPAFYNMSKADFPGGFAYRLDVLDASGAAVFSAEGRYRADLPAFSASQAEYADALTVGPLPAGEYTLQITVDPEGEAEEAYTVNNTDSTRITLKASEADASGVSLSIGEPYFSDSLYMQVSEVSCTGLDSLKAEIGEKRLYLSYYENGAWSPWLPAHAPEGGEGEVPAVCFVDETGEKLKALLTLRTEEGAPLILVESPPVELVYDRIAVQVSAGSHGDCRIRAGETALGAGEQFAFTLKNVSTTGNTLDYSGVEIYAINRFDDSYFVLWTQESSGPLKVGESSGEFVCTELTDTGAMAGDYDVYASVFGEWGYSEESLGTLHAEGDRVVFYSCDVAVEGLSAVISAVAYVPAPRDGSVRAWYGEDPESSLSTVYLSVDEELGDHISRYRGSTNLLKEGCTYYWKPYYYRYGEGIMDTEVWNSFTVPSLEELAEKLELDREASGSLNAGAMLIYAFTAPAEGSYEFSGTSGDYATVTAWNPDKAQWETMMYLSSYGGAVRSATRMLRAGETCYLRMQGSGDYTISVKRGADFVSAFSAPALTVTAEPFEIIAEAAAAVPYGANFQVFLDHGTETEYSTESFSYSDCRTGTVTRSWYFDLLPGEVMSLRVRLQDSDTGTEYAGAWQQVTGPTPEMKALTLDKAETGTLEAQSAAYFTFEAPEDGKYFAFLSGADCSLRIFLDGDWQYVVGVYNDEDTRETEELQKGTKYYFSVSGSTPGDFTLKLMRCGAATGDEQTSDDFTASLTVRAVVPENYGDYVVGVELSDQILQILGTPNSKRQSVKASGSGEVTESFTVEYCPGAALSWRAFLRNEKTGEEYLSRWESLYGWMKETPVTAGSTRQVSAEESGIYLSFAPPEDNVYAAAAVGEGGVLLRWDPQSLAWEEAGFASGSDAVFTFTPAYYEIRYMAGSGGVEKSCRSEYFRLKVTAGAAASFTVRGTKETASSVATGDAVPEAFSAELAFTAALGYGAEVRAGVAYGLAEASLNYVWSDLPEGGEPGELALAVTAETLPDSVYLYRAVLYDKKTGAYTCGEWKRFTTPAAELPELKPDVLSDRRDAACCKFTAPREGIYTLTASGEDVLLSVCGRDGLWRDYRLDENKRTVSFTLASGEILYIRQAGEARLMMSGGFASAEFGGEDASHAQVHLIPEEDGFYVVAAYTAGGRQLALKTMSLTAMNHMLVELSADERIGYVKVFRLDDKNYGPFAAATALAAPEA